MNGRAQDEMLAEECGLDYDEVTADDNQLTEYDVWFHENEEAILIELAESGADREMDFDLEEEFNKRYQQYLAKKNTFECSKCNFKGNIDLFDDTECDGDIWGTCPNCHKHTMLFDLSLG